MQPPWLNLPQSQEWWSSGLAGVFLPERPPKSAGASGTISCPILVQELLPNTTLGTYLEHSKALLAVGARESIPWGGMLWRKALGTWIPSLGAECAEQYLHLSMQTASVGVLWFVLSLLCAGLAGFKR